MHSGGRVADELGHRRAGEHLALAEAAAPLQPILSTQRFAGRRRRLDDAAFNLLTSRRAGVTLVTLAPELTTSAMISRLARAGGRANTNASYAQMRDALDAGICSVPPFRSDAGLCRLRSRR